MNRNDRAQLAKETVELVARGWYEAVDGRRIDIGKQVSDCLNATRLYGPLDSEGLERSFQQRASKTTFEVTNETTLSAARRVVFERGRVSTLCLNFASALNPGGGFLGGSQAQEESLARSSALHASLLTRNDYYDSNRACGTALYTDHMIVSPDVPVFRDDDGALLAQPYTLSILTAPAVNAGAVKRNEPEKMELIRPTMANRITRVLALAAHHEYQHLILGAWGCGVFQNEPAEIAELFAAELLDAGKFGDHFLSVTFAVLDTSNVERTIRPFRHWFVRGN